MSPEHTVGVLLELSQSFIVCCKKKLPESSRESSGGILFQRGYKYFGRERVLRIADPWSQALAVNITIRRVWYVPINIMQTFDLWTFQADRYLPPFVLIDNHTGRWYGKDKVIFLVFQEANLDLLRRAIPSYSLKWYFKSPERSKNR